MRIGILTGGGDSPAVNAAIRAVVKKCKKDGIDVLGILNGWAGLVEGETMALSPDNVSGILLKGGTILGTSRTNPFKLDKVEEVKANIVAHQIDRLKRKWPGFFVFSLVMALVWGGLACIIFLLPGILQLCHRAAGTAPHAT